MLTLASFIVSNGWIFGGAGGIGGIVAGFMTSTWRFVALAVAIAGIAIWIMGLYLGMAHLETKLATITGELQTKSIELVTCQEANKVSQDSFDQLKAATARTIDAVVTERNEAIKRAASSRVIKETIHVADNSVCGPMPPAFLAAARGVRDRQRGTGGQDGVREGGRTGAPAGGGSGTSTPAR